MLVTESKCILHSVRQTPLFQSTISQLEQQLRLVVHSTILLGQLFLGDEVRNKSEFHGFEPIATLLLLRNGFLDWRQCCEECHDGE